MGHVSVQMANAIQSQTVFLELKDDPGAGMSFMEYSVLN